MVKTYGSFKYFHLAQWLALALAPANKINRWFFLGHRSPSWRPGAAGAWIFSKTSDRWMHMDGANY
jgi:hypothetical protein